LPCPLGKALQLLPVVLTARKNHYMHVRGKRIAFLGENY